MKLYVKNMVCDRCKRVAREELERLGVVVNQVELGIIDVDLPSSISIESLKNIFFQIGFELIANKKNIIIENLKTLIIDEIQHQKAVKPESMNFSDFIAHKIGYDYSYLSNLFSHAEGISIEKYIIHQKIEKVKEWLFNDDLSLSDMAWRLNYSSVAHLSNQFKIITGMTPTTFKRNPINRLSIDRV